MVANILVIMLMEKKKDKEYLYGLMDLDIKDNSYQMLFMVKVNIYGEMEENM